MYAEPQRKWNTYLTFRLTVDEAERIRKVSEETEIPISRLIRKHLATLLQEPAKPTEPAARAGSP
jgi:hypothetical protein